jgi:hypothetical protein
MRARKETASPAVCDSADEVSIANVAWWASIAARNNTTTAAHTPTRPSPTEAPGCSTV